MGEQVLFPLSGWSDFRIQLPVVHITTALAAAWIVLIVIYWNRALGSHAIPRQVAYGPNALPLLGNALFAMKNMGRLALGSHKYWRSIGMKNFAISIPGQPIMLFTADPANIEHVTKTKFDNYVKGDHFRSRMADAMGDGVFITDGHAWWLQRKSISCIFSEAAFSRFMEAVFSEEMVVLRKRLDKAAETGAAVDLYALLHCFTFDAFCKLALGLEMNSLAEGGASPVMDALDRITTRILGRFFLPLWKLREKLTPEGRNMENDIKLVRGTFSKIVREKLDMAKHASDGNGHPTNKQHQCKDLITLVIQLCRSEPDSQEILTEKFLVDMVISTLLAGRDTTAQAVSWCLEHLRQHPAAMVKIREEVKSVTGDRDGEGADSKIAYKEVKKLKYTTCALQESLRYRPIVGLNMRTSLKADVLPDGTPVPAGAVVLLGIISVCRHPLIWGADAEEFRPERWFEMESQPSTFNYPVFYAGPRVCVGRNMALIEGTYILAELLSRYSLQLVDGHVVTPKSGLTMGMANGYKVHVRRLSPEQ